MPCFIFFLFLFLFCFSRVEFCSARYLSSSGPLYHTTTQERETETGHNGLMPDPNSNTADVIFQQTPQGSSGASPTAAPTAQDDATQENEQNLKETEKDELWTNEAEMNKSDSNVSPSAEDIKPSFDYSDYSRPRTRPPSHN